MPSLFDLYFAIGKHKIDVRKLSKFIQDRSKEREMYDRLSDDVSYARHRQDEFEDFLEKTIGKNSDKLILEGDAAYDNVQYAKCCDPIPGDQIIGFVEPKKKRIVIHRTNCERAKEMLSSFGKKAVKVNWGKGDNIEFLVSLQVMGKDEPGMLNKLIRVISIKYNKNMRKITISANGGVFEGQFKIFVRDTEDLEQLIEELGHVKGVTLVSRVQ